MGITTRADICLQWRLPIEFDGEVDDITTLHEAERRSVGPTTGNINAHRTSRPHYLVAIYRHARRLLLGEDSLGEPVLQ